MPKRRFAAVLASTGLVLGGGTVAWAANSTGSTAPAIGIRQQDDPASSVALNQCFTTAGVIKGQQPTDAQRQAFRACAAAVGSANGDFHGPAGATLDPAKGGARSCFSNSGVVKGETPTDAQRQALKTCLAAAGAISGSGPGPEVP